MLQRETLERQQVWLYLGAVVVGAALGHGVPRITAYLQAWLWPLIAALLFATFVQTPLAALGEAIRDRRFAGALIVGNFVFVPLLVGALTPVLPDDPAVRLGVWLVLLVPCTDWFITFTHLGRGDAARAAAMAPLLLVLQIPLLPLYLWWLSPAPVASVVSVGTLLPALAVVLGPLALAGGFSRGLAQSPRRLRWQARLAWWPVPLLAVVIALVVAGHADALVAGAGLLPVLTPVFVGFLAAGAGVAWLLARRLALPAAQARTLAFSLGTRNSFVVLPLALALPAGWEATALVIVMQSIVELLGMFVYLRWLPRWRVAHAGDQP